MNKDRSEYKQIVDTKVSKRQVLELLGKTASFTYYGEVVNVNKHYIHLKLSNSKPRYVAIPYHPKMEVVIFENCGNYHDGNNG